MNTVVSRSARTVRRVAGEQRGAALVTALVLMLAMLTLTVALLSTGTDEVQVAENHFRATQAQFLAEAGLEMAYTTLRTNALLITNAPASFTTLTLPSPGGEVGAAGAFAVQYKQGPEPQTVIVMATGTEAKGGQRTLRSTLTTAFGPDGALLVDGKLKMHAEVQVTGSCANVHSNDEVDVNLGSKGKIEGALTGSGTKYNDHDGKGVGPGSGGGKPKKEIPVINPVAFLNQALADVAAGAMAASELFQFMADGRVLDGNGAVLVTLKHDQKYNGFKYKEGDGKAKPAKWELKAGDNPPDGTYYFNGDTKIEGDFKKALGPWVTTLLADATIEIKGKPEISNHLRNTLAVAGGDLHINLDKDKEAGLGVDVDIDDEEDGMTGTGLVAAHEQVRLGGGTVINGYVIAENFKGPDSTLSKEVHIHGKTKIHYDCGALRSPLTTTLRVGTWGL